MDLYPDFRVLSICSGSGAGDLGLRLAMPGARTVCYVEIEAHCIASLGQKMESGALAPAPVWTDAKTFDGRPWRRRVHCVLAAYPCQPFSCAGKRLGAEDPRHIWPHIYRIIQDADPDFVFLENVRGHLQQGFREVKLDLERAGYAVEPGLFSAEEVGAPHARVRLFALAYKPGAGAQLAVAPGARLPLGRDLSGDRGEAFGQPAAERGSAELGHGEAGHEQRDRAGATEARQPARGPGPELVDALRSDGPGDGRDLRVRRRARQGGAAVDRPIPFPPYRTGDDERWTRLLVSHPWLRPALSQAETECLVRRAPHGLAAQLVVGTERTDRLRAVGNGIAPLALAVAFRVLAERAGIL